jgi:acetolactate synthase-1/2/3 large subunit
MSNSVRLSDYVIEYIGQQGVKHIFLVAGGGAMHLNDALVQSKDVSYVPNHHEQASTIAAEAYARVNGKLGAAMLTTGPGTTNGVTGVAGAWIESSPLIVISGQVKRSDLLTGSGLRQKGVCEVDIVSIVSPITKYAVVITDPQTIRFHLEKAIHLATTGRRGPVWIDIPLDVQAAMIEPEKQEGYAAPVQDISHLDAQVKAIYELIAAAERPVLLAGHGTRLAGAAESFKELYNLLQIPVVTTWNASDLIPWGHELHVGRPGTIAQRPGCFAVQNSDLLITIGARLDNIVTAYNPAKFARAAKKVVVDVDQNELNKFKMKIEQAVCADASDFINKMLLHKNLLKKVDRSEWLSKCAEWKRKYPPGDGKPMPPSGPISIYHFTDVLSAEIPEDTLIVTGSAGAAVEIFYSTFKHKKGQRTFLTSGLGSMGYGFPAMTGASLAYGERPFVGIESDGSLQMNMQELSTIKTFNIPVRIFVMNNHGYASIRTTQRNYFKGRYIGSCPEAKLEMPDTVALAQVMGIPAIRVSDTSELVEKVRHTLAQPGPFLCDVELIADEPVYPRSTAMPQPDGTMLSMPLEDLWPLLPREELRSNMLIPLDPASEAVAMPEG